MTWTRWFACGMMLLGSVRPAHAQGGIAGDWHGVLQSPIGPMTLIVTITEAEPGGLRGEMESPDQGPRRMPLSTLTATDRQLSFTIAGAQISYEGEWDEAAGQWAGVFTQGVEMPLVLRRGQPPPRPTIEGLDGLWQGIVRRNGVDLRLVLRVATGHRGTISTFDSPDIGVAGLPVAGFSRRGQTVDFTVPASGARFAGTLTDDGTAVRGTWTLPGQPDAAVAFTRVKTSAGPEARRRPQTPAPPLPYRLADVTFDNRAAPDVTLAGTLTLPAGDGPFPAAILITGSGPQDRDETLLGHKPFAVLADHLTRRGVAVLRYDDRGVARSTGDFASATSADFAADAAAAVQYLRTRSEIDRQAIGLIGHSEGGLVAPIAAADNEHVRFVVLLAGPGTNLVQLAQSQHRLLGLSQGASEAELTRMTPILADVFSAVAASESADDARARARAILTSEVLATLKTPDSRREWLVQQLTTDWFRYFLRLRPEAFLSRLRVPVLALNGSLDRQVPADENLAAIRAALAHNPDVTVRKLDGLNHLFQVARTGAIGEYADIAETMSPIVLTIISEWIEARFLLHAGP